MRRYAVLLSAVFTLTLAAGADARDRNIDAPHVRPLSQASGALMIDAQQRSATVRELMSKLDDFNLVAYVSVAPRAGLRFESGLSYVGTSKVQRFVMISIADDTSADRRIELLGHELQHAVEAAGRSWVNDDQRLQTMMTMIGWRDSAAARGYETVAANVVERQVRKDVIAANAAR